jgi:8-oxo-dGTP pyrophosphatase MutT (NUDIX family)
MKTFMEKNETIEQTAIREVQEETGVTGLVITEKLQKTYHIFKRNGRYKLKITQWFEMRTKFEGTPQGQAEEGIDEVAWVHPQDIAKLLENSYENIKLLFEKEKSN